MRLKLSTTLAWAAPLLLITVVLYTLRRTSAHVAPHITQHEHRRNDEAQCPINSASPDACALFEKHCSGFDDDGLVPYARLYACATQSTRPLLLVGMHIWLVVLFASMATAASDFLAVHLQFIVKTLGISENLAGVTIFAFGNGCTDLFSTFGM